MLALDTFNCVTDSTLKALQYEDVHLFNWLSGELEEGLYRKLQTLERKFDNAPKGLDHLSDGFRFDVAQIKRQRWQRSVQGPETSDGFDSLKAFKLLAIDIPARTIYHFPINW